jgi:phospholipase/carboxylesterase
MINRLPTEGAETVGTKSPRHVSGRPPQPPVAARRAAAFYLPARYEPRYEYPLVVWLHDEGSSERQVTEVMPHVSTQNYVAIGVRGCRATDAAGHRFGWLDSPSGHAIAEESVFEAIDTATRRYSLHRRRIFLAGYRDGGTMALRLALRHPQTFRAAVSIGGGFPQGGRLLAQMAEARELDLFGAVAMQGDTAAMEAFHEALPLLHAARLKLELRQYTVDDPMDRSVLRDVNRWLMQRVLGAPPSSSLNDWSGSAPVGFSKN